MLIIVSKDSALGALGGAAINSDHIELLTIRQDSTGPKQYVLEAWLPGDARWSLTGPVSLTQARSLLEWLQRYWDELESFLVDDHLNPVEEEG